MRQFLEPSLVITVFHVEDVITTSAIVPDVTEGNGIELPDIDIPG